MPRGALIGAFILGILTSVACRDPGQATRAGEPALHGARGVGPSYTHEFIYEDSYVGITTDGWAPDPTYGTPEEIEIVAGEQTVQEFDGRRECPVDQHYVAQAPLRKIYNGETLDFVFRSPFIFQRHVSRDGSSPWPTAIYRFGTDAYTRDGKYYAPAGNSVLLACDGRYSVNNALLRVWRGHLYGRVYNGPIVRVYDADGGGDTTCSGGGAEEESVTSESGGYSPAGSVPGVCGSGGGASSEPPLAEDEWYAWYEGIRFRCRNIPDSTGWDVISCTVSEDS